MTKQRIIIDMDGLIRSTRFRFGAAIIVFLIVIGLTSLLSSCKLDLTQGKIYSLSPVTKEILADVREDITITLYVSEQLLEAAPHYIPFEERVRFLLEEMSQENDHINFAHIRPELFSELEDEAVEAGIRAVPLNDRGDNVYFGIHIRKDDEPKNGSSIEFLQLERESFLEYDIVKMLSELQQRNIPTIGIISDADPLGYAASSGGAGAWSALSQLEEFYTLEPIFSAQNLFEVAPDMLLIMHLAQPSDEMLWGIEQYLLRGGRALIYADPVFESGAALKRFGVGMNSTESLNRIFKSWGLHIPDDKVVFDPDHGILVNAGSEAAAVQPLLHGAWMRYESGNISQGDVVTTRLELLNFITAGEIQIKEAGKVQLDALVTSTEFSQLEDVSRVTGKDPDLEGALKDFTPVQENKRILAARIIGNFETIFPKGRPASTEEDTPLENKEFTFPKSIKQSEKPFEVLLISDVDMLMDHFWVRKNEFLGEALMMPFAGNGAMLENGIENLSGLPALSRLRSRGTRQRPFTLLDNIKQHAERNYRVRANELSRELQDLQARIDDLQTDPGTDVEEERAKEKELEESLDKLLKTRKELRAVRRNLNRDYEIVGALLVALNVVLMPVIIIAIGGFVFMRRRKKRMD